MLPRRKARREIPERDFVPEGRLVGSVGGGFEEERRRWLEDVVVVVGA